MIGTRLLLVDDEEAFVQAMRKRIEHRGVEVITAASGGEALKALRESAEIDVVLLDVKMPGMDGIEVLKKIKSEHPIVEVIMLTGHATVEDAIEGMKLGAYDFLMKPADLEELVSKIELASRKKHNHQEKILEAAGKYLRSQRGR
jgi:DNA-binding NtrC family response regulator